MVAIWLPAVFLGVAANKISDVPGIQQKIEARRQLATEGPSLSAAEKDDLRRKSAGDDVLLILLGAYAPAWLAGILAAGIMAVVMASDSQILALSTMFTEDIFAYYGGKEKFGEHLQVQTGRVFIILLTVAAYLIALRAPETIFSLAVQYAFSGYSALMPLLVAALFWRRSTKWGALAATLWVAAAVAGVAIFQAAVPAPAPGQTAWSWSVAGIEVLSRTPGGTAVFGFMPVVPMVIVSALLIIAVSLATRKPSEATLARYFTKKHQSVARAEA
jgi:SSS family solute:Na+ symporter